MISTALRRWPVWRSWSAANEGPDSQVSRQPCCPHQQAGPGTSCHGPLGARPRQRVVPPFARDRVGPTPRPAIERNASANASAEDHGEHDLGAARRTVRGFTDREAVGVVLQPHRALQEPLEILAQRTPVQHGRVGVLHAARRRRNRARDRKPHRHSPIANAEPLVGELDESCDRAQRAVVVTLRRRQPFAQQELPGPIEARNLDLRAAEIDTEEHVGARGGHRRTVSDY
jgi:hypothetical protein